MPLASSKPVKPKQNTPIVDFHIVTLLSKRHSQLAQALFYVTTIQKARGKSAIYLDNWQYLAYLPAFFAKSWVEIKS